MDIKTTITYGFENCEVIMGIGDSIDRIIDPAIETFKKKLCEAREFYVSDFLAHKWPRCSRVNLILEIRNITPTHYPVDINKRQTLVLSEGGLMLKFSGFLQEWSLTSMDFVVLEITDQTTKEYVKFGMIDGEIHYDPPRNGAMK